MNSVMKIFIAFCLSFGCAFSLASCNTSSQYTNAKDLSPDTPSRTMVQKGTDIIKRLTYQADWLWSSYTKLKETIDPKIDCMKQLYVNAQEMVVSVKSLDVANAIIYFNKAKQNITDIVGKK